jgi:hypothetical protein
MSDERARRGGRPRVHPPKTVKAHVKIPADVYDVYCRIARRQGVSLHSLFRLVLSRGVSGGQKTPEPE